MDILSLLSRADEMYHRRARPGSVKESVALLASVPDASVSDASVSDASVSDASARYEIQWRLARSLFFLGQESDSIEARRQLHAAGIEAAERAADLNPERVEGVFWLGVNLALFAQAQSGLKGARAIFRARRALKRAVAISEQYHGAGPLRVLGRLEHKAPWLIGGSRKRSRKLFERAIEIAPANSVTLLYAAELAIDAGERDRAAALLEKLIDLPADPDWEFENRRDRRLARSLLERLRERRRE